MTDIDNFVQMFGAKHKLKIEADDEVIFISINFEEVEEGDLTFVFSHSGKFDKALGLEWR